MTYRSLSVEHHETPQSANAKYDRTARRPRFVSLNAFAWPASSHTFAIENGLEMDLVDNCWSRVAVTGAQLRSFLDLGVERGLVPPETMKRIDDESWYVIEEEEF